MRPCRGAGGVAVYTVDELLEQEARLRFAAFDNDIAWALGVRLAEAARAEQLPVAISLRRNGQRLFHAALDGTSADNDAWLDRKCRVVDRFAHSSLYVGELARSKGSTFEETFRLDPDRYAAHGGAFPVAVTGVGVIGTVAVSGLPQVDDHRFVIANLEAFLA
ncbi:heme-degrading domain-containing protein [Allokutzneria oryzae]|uniref:UPF0303 protein ACFFQA_17165 n=1 Tax=Allokutzneria oryzae TaxID=1378989 RepID=A0ABV5ZXN2_9PSEU